MTRTFATACLLACLSLAAPLAAQDDTSRTAGGPLKGIDIKAGKEGETARTDGAPLKGVGAVKKDDEAARTTGAPLKGVDVKLGKEAAARCAAGQQPEDGSSCPAPAATPTP